ncbi:MAG TPA: glycoside hydrolase family 99-like domain-containing protein [Burkholderiaceae bacterium]|nr:glycoside hydrolase family 99-like domain-containing protein [Burkholderiaceae bacterium]
MSSQSDSNDQIKHPRIIAFYLPQFHPIPENDLWWGKGFTEWTNVTKALPLFEGHYQPHLPTDFGFYDLRVRETRHNQIKTAKQYGIDGFCYHYYWFSGKRLLNKPLDEMLLDPASDMPFCLCWANENWTRRWDASEHEILIEQRYQIDDDLNFIKSIVPFFKDPRYIKVNDAPFFIVYRPQQLPDAKRSITIWREYCASIGIPNLHIVSALTHGNLDYEQFGFDGGVAYPPHNLNGLQKSIPNNTLEFYNDFSGIVCNYKDVAELYLNRKYNQPNVFRTVFPSWDNSARTGNRALIVLNGTPANYQNWLSKTITQSIQEYPNEDRLIFINAWNEWAEGCHIEPDRKYGLGFLEATHNAKFGLHNSTAFPDIDLPQTKNESYQRSFPTNLAIKPNWLVHSHLMEHLPFIAWLIKLLTPNVVVELGMGCDGNSFCLINQIITENKFKTKVLATVHDTERDVYKDLLSYVKTNYPTSTISFQDNNELIGNILDSSVDLLLLSDIRNAEKASELMRQWKPKLSDKSVILVGNTNWHSTDCDMSKFWSEFRLNGTTFHFLRSHGMGVLLFGEHQPKILQKMDDADVGNPTWVYCNHLFETAGKLLEKEFQLKKSKAEAQFYKTDLLALRNSKSWRVTSPFRKVVAIIKKSKRLFTTN